VEGRAQRPRVPGRFTRHPEDVVPADEMLRGDRWPERVIFSTETPYLSFQLARKSWPFDGFDETSPRPKWPYGSMRNRISPPD
jgi:hypothetical protein